MLLIAKVGCRTHRINLAVGIFKTLVDFLSGISFKEKVMPHN